MLRSGTTGNPLRMITQEYATGRSADLFGDMSRPTVLLWHGMQTDSRAALDPLATELADRQLGVVVPDWNSHADDGGRSDLLGSVRLARQQPGADEGLALVGWSMGGVAAAGLSLHAKRLDVSLRHTLCLAGAFMAKDPISGESVGDALATADVGAPFTLLHGLRDDVVPVETSRSFARDLRRIGWPVDVVELDTDHGAIAGARYDAANDRYLAADDASTRTVVRDVAARIAAVVGH
jgi:dienelactone hydrolase